MPHGHRTLARLAAIVSLPAVVLAAPGYAEFRSAAIRKCEAIDPAAYQSGLYFNPDGYRSFYVRSECFQEAAVTYRDEALCREVKERKSLLASSWGYSPSRCLEEVRRGAAADRQELLTMKQSYAAGAVRLQDFRIERNGNGRDFDIIPLVSGAYAHQYRLTFEIVDEAGRPAALLHEGGYHFGPSNNIRIFVRQAEVRERMPAFTPGQPYAVRARMVLEVGMGGPSGYWSDAFIEGLFPAGERTQSITRRVVF
jgi:hypothetical protein